MDSTDGCGFVGLLLFPGNLVLVPLSATGAVMLNPPIIDRFRDVLEGLRAGDGFLLQKGLNGQQGLD